MSWSITCKQNLLDIFILVVSRRKTTIYEYLRKNMEIPTKNWRKKYNFLDLAKTILDQFPTSTHVCVRITSLKLIGQLYIWVKHQPQGDWLLRCIQFLLTGLAEQGALKEQFQVVSAEGIEKICRRNSKELSIHHYELLQAVDQILDGLVWKPACNVLTGLSHIISECK